MRPAQHRTGWWWSVWPIVAGALALVLFHVLGQYFFDGYTLDLGSTRGPTPRYKRFLSLWGLFGTVAALLIGVGVARATESSATQRLRAWWHASSDAAWMAGGALAGFLIPLALRLVLLHGAPLTDDESAYRFMAELLAHGRLWVDSPPLKLFFDRAFMINDGRLYSQYFAGWPLLMVPGVWFGSTGMMNALYSALTIPALFLVARRLAGRSWAKAGVLLYLGTPMLMVGAATELSHTSCLAALAWMTWFLLRSRDADAPWWAHSGVASCFGVAFFIRPSSALGIGLPLLAWWVAGLRHRSGAQLATCLATFLVPTLLLAGLFLTVNRMQNGSFTTSSYQRFHTYMTENGYRFSGFEHWDKRDLEIVHLDVPSVLGSGAIALFRLNFDLFGWPCSFLFALLAGVRRLAGLFWVCLASFFCATCFLFDSGIDSFGPVHYFETAWPILLLSILGLRNACETPAGAHAQDRGPAAPRSLPSASMPVGLLAGLLVASLVGYVPVRLRALAQMAGAINTPRDAAQRAGLHHAVIFAPRPFVALCGSWPNEHFVEWRPNNDPDLRNDLLWVNHISIAQDRRLMHYFPDHQAYVMQWTPACTVQFLPLEALAVESVPDGFIGGTGEGPS